MSDNNRVKLAHMVENSGMLRIEVSKYLGIHQRTLYRYLSGELEIPVMVMLAMELLAKGR
jgi:predicted DNA-binding transcriptional regulator AlpA